MLPSSWEVKHGCQNCSGITSRTFGIHLVGNRIKIYSPLAKIHASNNSLDCGSCFSEYNSKGSIALSKYIDAVAPRLPSWPFYPAKHTSSLPSKLLMMKEDVRFSNPMPSAAKQSEQKTDIVKKNAQRITSGSDCKWKCQENTIEMKTSYFSFIHDWLSECEELFPSIKFAKTREWIYERKTSDAVESLCKMTPMTFFLCTSKYSANRKTD